MKQYTVVSSDDVFSYVRYFRAILYHSLLCSNAQKYAKGKCRLIILKILLLLVLFPDHLHVLPYVPLKLGVSQEEGGVIRGHELGTVVCVEASPEGGNPFLCPQEGPGSKGPEAADDPWFDDL